MVTPNEVIGLTTTARPIAGPNKDRTSLAITNLDPATTVYITFEPGGTTTGAIPLYPLSTIIFSKGDGDEPGLAFYGLVGAGTANILTTEQWGE